MTRARDHRASVSAVSLIIVSLAAVACSRIGGSGKIVTKPISVSSFSKLQVGSAFEVNVSFGDQEALTLRIDDNLADHVDAGVSGGTLHIGLKPRTSVHDATLKADVTARSLTSIELSGASRVHLSSELSGPSVKLTASGASELDGSVRADEVSLSLSGASSAKLSGNAARLVVSGSGACKLDALQLQSTDLEISLSGASDASVSVSGTISAVVSGASNLRYRGSPRFIKKEASGASDIQSV